MKITADMHTHSESSHDSVCPIEYMCLAQIEKGTNDLDAILKESEKVAVYNELTHKQALQLRLICEEIDGMLPNVIEDFVGNLWIEYDGDVCKINVFFIF